VSYSYGAAADGRRGFHLAARYRPSRGVDELLSGFLLRDGQTRRLLAGGCRIERDGQGRPIAVRLRGTSEDGEELRADGEVMSRLSMPSTPWFVWACVVRWTLPDGSTAYGEHQDAWSPALLRSRLRASR
jgi:hypothetical protein